MFINKKLLEVKDACLEQLKLFNRLFPNGVELTLEVCLEHYNKFDLNWCVENLLNDTQREAYEEARVPLWKTYEEARVPLWKAYVEAEAPLWEAYEETVTPLWKTYDEARVPLWKAYVGAKVKAFFNATQT